MRESGFLAVIQTSIWLDHLPDSCLERVLGLGEQPDGQDTAMQGFIINGLEEIWLWGDLKRYGPGTRVGKMLLFGVDLTRVRIRPSCIFKSSSFTNNL